MTMVRQMAISEFDRIADIDRSEQITQQYKSHGSTLELVDVDIHAPRWGEPGEHTVQHYIDSWKPLVESGGVLVGAFDGDRLVGFAVYEPPGTSLSEGLANLAVLHVTRTHRGSSSCANWTEMRSNQEPLAGRTIFSSFKTHR